MDNFFDPKEYWEKRLRENYDLSGVGFAGIGRYYNDWLYRIKKQMFLRQIDLLHLNYHDIDVLDIGSGTGFYVEIWQSLGVRSLIGTDITSIAVERLCRKFPDFDFYQLDVGGSISQFPRKKFDVISAFDVLYHIVDDNRYQQAFENISEMLLPGGIFIFSENFIHGETVRAPHQVSRSLKDIEHILNSTNFRVRSRVPMFVLMNYPIDSSRTVLKFLWQGMMMLVNKVEFLGFVIGGLLYPVELVLTSLLKESPLNRNDGL